MRETSGSGINRVAGVVVVMVCVTPWLVIGVRILNDDSMQKERGLSAHFMD